MNGCSVGRAAVLQGEHVQAFLFRIIYFPSPDHDNLRLLFFFFQLILLLQPLLPHILGSIGGAAGLRLAVFFVCITFLSFNSVTRLFWI